MPEYYPEHQPQYQPPQYNQYPPQQAVYVVIEPPRPSVVNLALYALIASILCFPLGLVLTIIFYAMAASAKKRLGYAPDGTHFVDFKCDLVGGEHSIVHPMGSGGTRSHSRNLTRYSRLTGPHYTQNDPAGVQIVPDVCT